MPTWVDRLKAAIGPRGYETGMRRSLQTVVLYEAKRCIASRLSSLRPFQRKAAFIDQAFALLEDLDFLYPHQKAEILWRTASSKEQLDAEIAWKRVKSTEKELTALVEKIQPFVSKASTHDEAVNMLIQSLYEQLSGFVGKPAPQGWEHAHNHCMLTFRMYYRFEEIDPDFPPPVNPRNVFIPTERPKPTAVTTATKEIATEPHIDVAELLGESKVYEDRRKILQEVREHLELLKEFEGIVPDSELAQRKRELFAALPRALPVPSAETAPSSAKRQKKLELLPEADS